jgi:hypothetical protein
VTDYRALCAELVDELDYQTSNHEADELIDRARAALAEPDGPAVSDDREPASVVAEARTLSPAAHSVVQAFDARYELCGPFDGNWQEECLAAALRAVAGQFFTDWDGMCCEYHLNAIATELEGHHG